MPTYRDPDGPPELPDIVGASAKRAAIRLALVGLASIAGGAALMLTTVILFMWWVGVLAIVIGVVLEVSAIVFWLRNRGVS
jgi:hypothetical protein